MGYDEIVKNCEQLSYRDKFRLAQLLIQFGRKEEEDASPDGRKLAASDPELTGYVLERLQKSKPAKKAALLNFIGVMFQFQGGISDDDKEAIVRELQNKKQITVDQNGKVSYTKD
ncbi:MAG: hypothetical protein GDA55_06945 [Cellvibrionales bacterium]|nr:hypothetical protein [Cellvibrionales bacterium]